ncbi:MAG TPA: PTS lactose transporter subunit IIC [Rhodobacteraceae bacterium]|jgi:PTS system nitrogen regulatory IIA component|nr:PTS lactose transporter subunit IIC [Paracoccaceae bacterium]
MELSDILMPEAVRVVGQVSSKKRLFQQLGEIVSSAHNIELATAVKALQDREKLGSTGVGHGVALPHARISGIDSVIGGFLRVEQPLDFDAVDRQSVDLIFTLFAPIDSGVEHLKALALVSRTMRNKEICDKLRANSDPATLHALLTNIETTKAA